MGYSQYSVLISNKDIITYLIWKVNGAKMHWPNPIQCQRFLLNVFCSNMGADNIF